MSANPRLTARKNGIRAIDRMSIISIMKEIRDMDLFISGGLLFRCDLEKVDTLLSWSGISCKGNIQKKVMIYSQGMGPVTDLKQSACGFSAGYNKCERQSVKA